MLSVGEPDSIGLDGHPVEELSLPDTEHTQALLDLWKSKQAGSGLPCRADFSPAEMKSYLDRIYILEALDDGADFIVRLAGTSHTDMFGADFTGVKYSDEKLSSAAWRLEIFRKARTEERPVIFRFKLGGEGAAAIITENLILPVLDRDGNNSLLLCLSIPVGALDEKGQLRA